MYRYQLSTLPNGLYRIFDRASKMSALYDGDKNVGGDLFPGLTLDEVMPIIRRTKLEDAGNLTIVAQKPL